MDSARVIYTFVDMYINVYIKGDFKVWGLITFGQVVLPKPNHCWIKWPFLEMLYEGGVFCYH